MKHLIVFCVIQTLICFCSAQKEIKSEKNIVGITLTDKVPVYYIQSPGFPNKPYPKNYSVQYNLNVNLSDKLEQLGARLQIKLEFLAIEPSDNCKNDRLEVVFPKGQSNIFCNIHAGKTMVSESTSVSIIFSSNDVEEERGFNISVEVVRSKCLFKYQNIREGIIRSPNYPNDYRKEETCVWQITVDEGKFVKLTFKEPFDINTSMDPPVCTEDHISISKAGDLDAEAQRFCGKVKPDVIVSHSNRLLIRFNSDCCNTGKGFEATFMQHDKPEAAPQRLPMLTPFDCPCGQENTRAFRIVGGTEVIPHRYPWMAAIMTTRNSLSCGGVLINNCYILTAAHCVVQENKDTIRVRVGQHSLSESTPPLTVSRIIMHTKYNSVTQINDIALLRLKDCIEYSINILPVCLPPSDLVEPQGLFVAGWGRVNEGGPTNDRLREISLPPVTNAKCSQKFEGLITDGQLCAGGVEGQDACQGDSGGPLTIRSNNKVYAVGIVSWGIGCARKDSPGVYTRVTSYLQWIEENTRDAIYCLSPDEDTSSNLVIDKPIQPNYDNCGVPKLYPTNRIVGGTEAVPQEFPWTVVVAYNGQLICGGVLIAVNIVLTSAQKIKPIYDSLKSLDLSSIKITVGAHDITKPESTKRVYSANQIRFHPQFGINTPYDYDFALIELLATSEGFLEIHRPICLPRSNTPYVVGNPVICAGWGRTSTRSSGSPVLRKVTLQFTDRGQCTKTYQNSVTNSMVCAMATNKDMCLGDNGGPAMKYDNGRFYLAGIMSWGASEGCAVPGKPAVFADCRYALPWITYETGIETA